MSSPGFTISALQPSDIPAAGQIAEDSMLLDRQTQMKQLGPRPFSMRQHALDSMPAYLRHPRCVVLKAVDDASGDVIGVCNWGFRGIEPDEMPVVEGRVQPRPDSPKPEREEESQENKDGKDEDKAGTTVDDPIARLEDHTGSHFGQFMTDIMPPGVRCIYVVGLSVAPAHQRRGVGSALLRFGTRFCDSFVGGNVFAWVHSSADAWPMYQKCGFETIRTLEVDLDEYAPAPPPREEGDGATWGKYMFRYMQYLPQKGE